MNTQIVSFLSAVAAVFFLFNATAALAKEPTQPIKAVFYPDEVEVTVEEKLRPERLPQGGSGFLLAFPSDVKRDSLLVSIGDRSAGSFFWLEKEDIDPPVTRHDAAVITRHASLPENEPSPERRTILERLLPLVEATAKQEGVVAAADARLALWNKTLEAYGMYGANRAGEAMLSMTEEAAKLDAAYSQQYPELYLEREKQKRILDDMRLRLGLVKKELDDYDRMTAGQIVAVPFSASASEEQVVRYSYVLPANCRMNYRLNAQPDKNELSIAQEVLVTQYSGFAWTQVETYVSTIRRDRTLKPADILPWNVAFVTVPPAFEPRAEKNAMVRMASPAASMEYSADAGFGGSQAVQEEKGTFRLWSLGKRRIEHKASVSLPLSSDTYDAKFVYTLRPSVTPKGFLTAELSLPSGAGLELPPGMAQFSVDGSSVGNQSFSFNGNKGSIFFGSDPQVTATLRDLKQSGGEKGFFSKDQTLLWHWEMTLNNSRSKPVEVVLQDAAPDSRDDSITIKTSSTPNAQTIVNPAELGGAKIFQWNFTLEPGKPVVVNHKVEIAAPMHNDKELMPGR